MVRVATEGVVERNTRHQKNRHVDARILGFELGLGPKKVGCSLACLVFEQTKRGPVVTPLLGCFLVGFFFVFLV